MAEVILCGLCIATGVFIKKMADIRKDEEWHIKNATFEKVNESTKAKGEKDENN